MILQFRMVCATNFVVLAAGVKHHFCPIFWVTGRIIKGVAASAVAICFDDFNRMSMSVVSVVAQQLGVIRQATIEAVKEEFLFEGEKIRINETSYVFLTMNTMVFEKHTIFA